MLTQMVVQNMIKENILQGMNAQLKRGRPEPMIRIVIVFRMIVKNHKILPARIMNGREILMRMDALNIQQVVRHQ